MVFCIGTQPGGRHFFNLISSMMRRTVMTPKAIFRRRHIHLAVLLALGPALATPASAQTYVEPGVLGDAASWRTPEFLNNWGLGAIKADAAYAAGFTGKGIILGEVDSGFDTRNVEMPSSRYIPLITPTSSGAYNPDPAFNAGEGHGTDVGGILAAARDGLANGTDGTGTDAIQPKDMHGVAFNATVIVGNTNGTDSLLYGPTPDPEYPNATIANFASVYQGLVAQGARVINNSWGSPPGGDSYNTLAGLNAAYAGFAAQSSTWLDAAAAAARTQPNGGEGAVLVFSAGNGGVANPSVRGALPYFQPDLEGHWMVVTGVRQDGSGGYLQQYNQCGVAKYWCVAAPANNISSTGLDNTYIVGGGTSASAPHASAALGIIMERYPYMTNEQALQVLFTTATKLDGTRQSAPDSAIGWGLINLDNAMKGPGQLLNRLAVDLPGGTSDTWSNDISIDALVQRQREEQSEVATTQERADMLASKTYENGLTKLGDGALALTGTNTYTGDTVVSAGLLQLGDGGTGGSIISNVTVDAGALFAINRSDTYEFSPAISGTGSFAATGGSTGLGATVLGGINTYSGATAVLGGTLRAGSATGFSPASAFTVSDGALLDLNSFDETIGSLAGAGKVSLGSATLTTGGDNSSTWFSGSFDGNGGLAKTGTGAFILTGDSGAFTGRTSVANGILAVDGTLGGDLSVSAGGRLQGNGTVGNTTVAAGATVAPGNSIGLLNVEGDIRFAAGSTYEVEVDAAGQADRIAATGKATIDGGTVKVLAGTGDYAPSTTYSILHASGGVTGAFADTTSNLAFLTPSLGYSPDAVFLMLDRNDISFASVGSSPNQRSIGAGVEALPAGSPIYHAVAQMDAPGARAAFDSLSGEVHASAQTALIDDSRFVRDAALDRLRSATGTAGASSAQVMVGHAGKDAHAADPTTSGAVFWSQAFGSRGHADGNGNAAKLDRSISGLLIGVDASVTDTWRLGVLGGYSRSSFDVDERSSSGHGDNYHLGLYGGTAWGSLALRTGLAYTWHSLETSRQAAFQGFSDGLKGDYDASTTQAFGELGYSTGAGPFALEPFANLAHVHLHTDAFTEKGGMAALIGGSASTDVTFSTLGARAATKVSFGSVDATATGSLGWRHAFGDTKPFSRLAFASAGSFADIAGVAVAKDAGVIQLGLDFALTPMATLGVSYSGQFGSNTTDQSIRANLNVKF
jgi:subtilase-type serine protease